LRYQNLHFTLTKHAFSQKSPFFDQIPLLKRKSGPGTEGGGESEIPDPDVFFIFFLKYQGRDAEGGRGCEIPDPENSFLICFSFIA
jgi:hypothetical protein